MPNFALISADEAALKTATGKRAQIAKEYLGYIEQLGPGQAGTLSPAEGETIGAIRRRVGAAAKLAGKDLIIKRVDDQLYFWIPRPGERRSRRGRPGKAEASEA